MLSLNVTEKDDLTVPGSSKHRKLKSLSDPQPTSGKALTLDLTTTENASRFVHCLQYALLNCMIKAQ